MIRRRPQRRSRPNAPVVLDESGGSRHVRRMIKARIYQQVKNAMQSGKRGAGQWLLEYEPVEKRVADPLMGWTGSGDTQTQVQLAFPTLEAARGYAEQHGLSAHVVPAGPHRLKLQTYADNFK
jgi:hypothetical protein